MELDGKKIAILAENNYNTRELWYPYYRMIEAGAEVKIVGAKGAKEYVSKVGLPVKVDVDAEDVDPNEFDAVIIPGGYAPDLMRRHESMLRLVRKMNQTGKVVATICHAGWVAISAGILEGKKFTCTPAIKDDVINAGAEYVDEEVVVDGNLISSRKPDDLPAFCRAIIERLRV